VSEGVINGVHRKETSGAYDRDMIRPFAHCILACLLVGAVTETAPAAPPVRFACATSGETLIVPPASGTAVCERFRVSLARAARLALRADGLPATPHDAGAWIRVTLKFTKAGVASARVERSNGGWVIVHPESNVAVSDRAIGLRAVDLLAQDAAHVIDASVGVR